MNLLELYHYCNEEVADPRTNNWFLVSSPVPIILVTFAYLYFVLQCGPRYMKDRPAYSCYTFIRYYNIFQIVTNALIVYYTVEAGWYQDYFIYCVSKDYTDSEQNRKFTTITWYILCLKLVDYIETIVFVLRKKQRQVSFLHLYHHVSTAFILWILCKYLTTGMSMTFTLVNCSVHVIMYSYYLFSSYGPSVQAIMNRIKPMITIIQIAQFCILILHSAQSLFPYCHHMKVEGIIIMSDLIINFVLFYNFYRKTYVKKDKQN